MKKRNHLFILSLSALLVELLVGCDILQNLATPKVASTSEDATAGGGGLPPRAFLLISPPNGATNVSLTPTLQWEPSLDPEGGRIQYIVRLSTGEGGAKVTTVSQNFYTITTPLNPSTTYYWQVEAQDPAGNTKKTPYYSFTTGTGSTGGGTGGGGPSIITLSGFSQTDVRKGVILHNPNFSYNPNYLVYVYLTSSLYLYYRESFDGGNTWGAALPISGTSNARDLAAALDGNGNAVALIIDSANDDSGAGGRVIYSTHPYGGSWLAPFEIQNSSPPGLRRLPSVVHTMGNEYLFAYGYDNYGAGAADDTQANSVRWNGTSMDSPIDVGLSGATDNPVVCQQIAFDPSMGQMYYLYFDNHGDYEIDGGDIFVISGSYPSTWFGFESETRVVNAGYDERPGQGYLFHWNGVDFILIYALEMGPPLNPTGNTLYLKHAPTLAALESASPITLENALQYAVDTWSRYRTVYAAKDDSGNIHVVFQDQGNNIKWFKFNSSTYAVETSQTIATGQWLDSISLGGNKLYVSTISGTYSGNSASIIVVSF
jgi:hypothetical protein